MKPIHWILLGVVALLAYAWGRHAERVAALGLRVAQVEDRMLALERVSIRQEERWGWLKRIGQGARRFLPWIK